MKGGIILLALTAGCLSPVQTQSRFEADRRITAGPVSSQVSQSGGRDVTNVSPTVAISGGGGVLAATMVIGWLTISRLRTRRTLNVMIEAIEQLDNPFAIQVKSRISRAALSAGMADFLHAQVKQKTHDG